MTKAVSYSTLMFLHRAARLLGETLDSHEILRRMLHLTQQHYQPDAVSVAVVESDGSLTFQAASGAKAAQVVGMRLPPQTGIVGWVAERGQRLWVPDVSREPRHYKDVDRETRFQTRAVYAEPVKIGSQTLAVLEVINPAEGQSLSELQVGLAGLAALAAPAIRNAQLFEQAHRVEARYQHLFEYNVSPILVFDRHGRLLEANLAARTLLDISGPQIGQFCLDRLHLSEERFAALQEQLDTQDVVREEVQLRVGEETRHLEVSISRVPPDNYQWLAHDITARVDLERERQYFTDMIVHDLRNPLSSIIHSLELLNTAWGEMDMTIPVSQVLNIALRSSHKMERLISDILDSARLQVKQKVSNISEIEIKPLVQEAVEILQSSIERRHHTFTQQLADDLPTVRGDASMLQRVLLNVLNNAIKFTPNGGNISLAVEADDVVVRFTVRDDGPGIPPEQQPYIFDVFTRGNTGNVKGSGLGLAFCKLAVEAHGGTIAVQSEPGAGSTFIFTIPRTLPSDLQET